MSLQRGLAAFQDPYCFCARCVPDASDEPAAIIAMVIIWTDLACGDREAVAVRVARHSVFQVLAFGVPGWFYLDLLKRRWGDHLAATGSGGGRVVRVASQSMRSVRTLKTSSKIASVSTGPGSGTDQWTRRGAGPISR